MCVEKLGLSGHIATVPFEDWLYHHNYFMNEFCYSTSESWSLFGMGGSEDLITDKLPGKNQ